MIPMLKRGAVLALAVGALAACDDDGLKAANPDDLVTEARKAGNFTTLLEALEAAGLAGTLETAGPFTVFAPTDAAFAAVPQADLEVIVSDQDRLQGVLTYHVVSGELDAAAILEAGVLTTLNGQKLLVTQASDGTVLVDGVPVVQADVAASNGVIHAMGGVMLPSERDIVETAQADDRFQTLVTAVVEAELASTLAGEGPFTVFAPTNDAFTDLPEGALEGLLQDIPTLQAVLTYHVVSGRLLSPEVIEAGSVTTLQGSTLQVQVQQDGTVTVDGATILVPDVQSTNGVIHVIDRVLLPGS